MPPTTYSSKTNPRNFQHTLGAYPIHPGTMANETITCHELSGMVLGYVPEICWNDPKSDCWSRVRLDMEATALLAVVSKSAKRW